MACLIFLKKVAFHIYHGRNRLRGYFRQYDKNSNILQEKIKLASNLEDNGASLIEFYEQLCKKYNVSVDKYAVLFDAYKPKLFSFERFMLFLRRL